MADVIYNSFKKKIMDGSIDLDTDTIKVVLVTSSYTPNIDTHTQYSHITNQVTGTGYTAGGATLANKSVAVDTTNDRAKFDADDTTWTTASITARGAIIYKYVDNAGSPDDTSPLICYKDFGADVTSTNADFTIKWHADGILYLS
jgi:hypothetical protein